MNKKIVSLLVMIGLTLPLQARQHAHGEGELLIAQDGNEWQFQFNLPAEDVFGFEHAPETPEQMKQLVNRKYKIESNDNVVNLEQNCQLKNFQIHAGNTDSHGHSHSSEHQNIEFTYHFACSAPLKKVSIGLFDWTESLQHLEVQWITEKGQGSIELERDNPTITW